MDLPIHIALHIQGSLQFGKHPVPDAGLAPTLETAVDRGPLAVPFGHVAPGCACSEHPHNTIEEFAMILARSASCCSGFREQWFDPLPLFIREVATVSHGISLTTTLYFAYRP